MTNKTVSAACLTTLLALSFLLCGCQPKENPLATVPKSTAAKFLESASKSATNELKLGWGNDGYQQCMDGKHSMTDCNALYRSMLQYAKTDRLFVGLTLDQLTDQTVWKTLKGRYEEAVFTDIGN